MKKIFLDTNFIGDLFVERYDIHNPQNARRFKEDAQHLLIECKKRNFNLYITFLTVANFNYLARKHTPENRKRFLKAIIGLFNVIDNTREQVIKALKLDAPDFEDALQYIAALESNCDVIITRDKKGFEFSKIPVLSPIEFLSLIS